MPSHKDKTEESPNAKVARGDIGAFFPIIEEVSKTLKKGEMKVVDYHGTKYYITSAGHYGRVDKLPKQKGGSTMWKRRTNKKRRATLKRRTTSSRK
jgi:hypothetical protein